MNAITAEQVARWREEWKEQPLTEKDIADYRINYDVQGWSASEYRDSIPSGAVLAVERLCCEVESLRTRAETAERERDSLLSHSEVFVEAMTKRTQERDEAYAKGQRDRTGEIVTVLAHAYRVPVDADLYVLKRISNLPIKERPPVWPECKPSLSPEEFDKQYHGNWDEVVKREEKERP